MEYANRNINNAHEEAETVHSPNESGSGELNEMAMRRNTGDTRILRVLSNPIDILSIRSIKMLLREKVVRVLINYLAHKPFVLTL